MRGLTTYLIAGILVVLALGFVAPAAWLGLPVGARTVAEPGTALQTVNRANKGDRLPVPMTVVGKSRPTASDRQPVSTKPIKILDGCDPVFSPLSTSTQANLPGRCAA